MSKIDELIQELCPDGVAFAALKEVAEFRTGWTFPVSEQGLSVGDYPFYKVADMNNSVMLMGSAQNYISKETAKKLRCKPAPKGTIIFPKIGSAMGTNKKRILSVDSCYDNNAIGIIAKSVDSSYLYYIFSSLTLLDFANGTGAVPSLDKTRLENYKVPLPPLPIQQEIVRILDSFTELTAELTAKLTAELTARRKQYEYYRDELLTFGEDVPVFSLSEIATNCDRQRKPVTKGKREAGIYPYYGASGIVDYVADYTFEGDYLLISEDGANLLARSTPIAFSISGKNWVNNHAHVLKFETPELQKYVEIYLNSLDLSKYISGGAQPKLNQDNLNKIPIPLPSSGVKRIVDVLTHFDTICNDLTSGLPAEIATRQKQYEYYRDKLLTFKELEK